MNTARLYKFGFWALLLLALSLFNLWRITKTGYEKDFENFKEINEKRVSSLMISNTIIKRKISPISGQNIITKEMCYNLLRDTSLVILLSTFKCNECQEKELVRLNSFRKIMGSKGVNVIGITIKSEVDAVIRQRKITKIDFPIYWIDDDSFYNNIAFHKEFPQILLITDNIIVSGFIPVPLDSSFSENYFNKIINGKL